MDEVSFAGEWIDQHKRREVKFSADLLTYFQDQKKEAIKRFLALQPVAVRDQGDQVEEQANVAKFVDPAKLVPPGENDREFREIANRHIARGLARGVKNTLSLNKKFQNVIKVESSSFGKPLPKDVEMLIRMPQKLGQMVSQILDETYTQTYWNSISVVTRNKLRKTIERGLRDNLSSAALARQIEKDPSGIFDRVRANRIARTETTGALNGGAWATRQELYDEKVITAEEWLAILDDDVRLDHQLADGQLKGKTGFFQVGKDLARFPGDPELSAGQRINCRCTVLPVPSEVTGEALPVPDDVISPPPEIIVPDPPKPPPTPPPEIVIPRPRLPKPPKPKPQPKPKPPRPVPKPTPPPTPPTPPPPTPPNPPRPAKPTRPPKPAKPKPKPKPQPEVRRQPESTATKPKIPKKTHEMSFKDRFLDKLENDKALQEKVDKIANFDESKLLKKIDLEIEIETKKRNEFLERWRDDGYPHPPPKDLEKITKKVDRLLSSRRRKREEALIDAISDIIKPDNPIGKDFVTKVVDPRIDKAKSKATRKKADEFYRKVLAKKDGEKQFEIFYERATNRFGKPVNRAYHYKGPVDGDSFVGLAPGSEARTVVHEIGHGIETQLENASEAAHTFLKHRVGDEKLTRLKDIFPDSNYRLDEFGREDKFGELFGNSKWYVGKHYDHGSTEVISMGIEKFFADPVRMAKVDPEYTRFILGILDRSLLL